MKRFILAVLAATMVAIPVSTASADTFTAAELSKAQSLVYEVPATQKAMRDYVVRIMVWLNTIPSVANIVTNSTGNAAGADYYISSAGANKTVKSSGVLVANVPTMASAGGAGELVYTAAADKALAKSGIVAGNVPTMASAAGAADYFILSAGADKTIKASTTGPSAYLLLNGGVMTGKVELWTVAVSDIGSDDTEPCAAQVCKVTTKSLTTAAGACYSFTVTSATVAATTGVNAQVSAYTGAGFPFVQMTTPGAGSSVVKVCNLHATDALNAALTFDLFVGD